ncbi:hypothetical protein AAFF_G00406120 [Aldrovandia affinis]|uniref:Uncharacterized protein n=1 Tax=Aldrovandia affinis TaxID=143900 RepID=A0AAD7WK60_9TELE|nr:hypothetical protein AAFF_G00406120 [Aldrovandia affinis]
MASLVALSSSDQRLVTRAVPPGPRVTPLRHTGGSRIKWAALTHTCQYTQLLRCHWLPAKLDLFASSKGLARLLVSSTI